MGTNNGDSITPSFEDITVTLDPWAFYPVSFLWYPAAARLSRTTLKSEPTIDDSVPPYVSIRPLAPLTRLGNDNRASTPP